MCLSIVTPGCITSLLLVVESQQILGNRFLYPQPPWRGYNNRYNPYSPQRPYRPPYYQQPQTSSIVWDQQPQTSGVVWASEWTQWIPTSDVDWKTLRNHVEYPTLDGGYPNRPGPNQRKRFQKLADSYFTKMFPPKKNGFGVDGSRWAIVVY